MSRYRMDDGTVVDTDNAKKSWEELYQRTHGLPVESRVTLHVSRKGRYYMERTSRWQGATPGAEWISKRSAASWLLANEHEVPDDLKGEAEEVSE